MVHLIFATEAAADGSPLAALGVDGKSFLFQLITFVLVFLILKKFAFGPITKMLARRRQLIEEGVFMGQQMEEKMAKLKQETAHIVKDARIEADHIIATAQKDAREVIREAEKSGQRKVDAMIVDAEARIKEEGQAAKRRLEKEIVGLVSEATEAIVEEKVDGKKDNELIAKAIREQKA
jgi:F-type H+-transporting ATPase subunit b